MIQEERAPLTRNGTSEIWNKRRNLRSSILSQQGIVSITFPTANYILHRTEQVWKKQNEMLVQSSLQPPPPAPSHLAWTDIPSPGDISPLLHFHRSPRRHTGCEPGKSNTLPTRLFEQNFQAFGSVLCQTPALSRSSNHFVFSAADTFQFLSHTDTGSCVASSEG